MTAPAFDYQAAQRELDRLADEQQRFDTLAAHLTIAAAHLDIGYTLLRQAPDSILHNHARMQREVHYAAAQADKAARQLLELSRAKLAEFERQRVAAEAAAEGGSNGPTH